MESGKILELNLLSEPLGGHHEEALLTSGIGPAVFDLVSHRSTLIVNVHSGNDHGMVGHAVTGLKPL